MKTRKVLSLLLVVAFLLPLLVGCPAPATPAPAPTEAPPAAPPPEPETDAISQLNPSGQEVLFWHVSTRKHLEILEEIVDGFNETNPYGIRVVAQYAGYYSDIYNKIIAAIAAGDTPDLAIAYANQVADYARADVIVPLDPYLESEKYGFTPEERADFFEAFLESDRQAAHDNQLMSFAHSRSMQVMYYNQDWLEEMGYDGPPENWAEFKEMCVAATDPANDKWGYAHTGGASFFASMIFSHGGDILSEDAKTVKFNEEPGIKSLQVIQDLFNSGCTYEVAERYGEQTDFANQKTLFAFGSTAGLPYYKGSIEDAGEFEWSVAPPAHEIPEGVVDVYGPSAAIFKSKPERQLAAWLFFKYWAETENVTKWATAANYFPLRRSAIESPAMKEYLEGNPKYEKAFGFLPNGRVEPNVAGWQEIRSIMGDAMKQAVEGEDPKAILDAAAAEANAVLANQ